MCREQRYNAMVHKNGKSPDLTYASVDCGKQMGNTALFMERMRLVKMRARSPTSDDGLKLLGTS